MRIRRKLGSTSRSISGVETASLRVSECESRHRTLMLPWRHLGAVEDQAEDAHRHHGSLRSSSFGGSVASWSMRSSAAVSSLFYGRSRVCSRPHLPLLREDLVCPDELASRDYPSLSVKARVRTAADPLMTLLAVVTLARSDAPSLFGSFSCWRTRGRTVPLCSQAKRQVLFNAGASRPRLGFRAWLS